MRSGWIVALTLILLAATTPFAYSPPMTSGGVRGLYYQGKIHYVCPGNSASTLVQNNFVHCQGTPAAGTRIVDLTLPPTAMTPLPPNCYGFFEGGAGIMNDKIFSSATFWLGSSSQTSEPWLYCAVYDLPTNTFTSLTKICKLDDPNEYVHSALTILEDKVCIFTNTVTVTSSDGVHWATQPPVLTSADKLTPVDAITFYPMGDAPASVMILCADSTNYYKGGAYSVIWNGKFGADSVTSREKVISNGMYYGFLFQGTANPPAGYGYAPGAKAPCIQAFINAEYAKGLFRCEYNLATQKWSVDPYSGSATEYNGFDAFPWYEKQCASGGEMRCMQKQYLVVNGTDSRFHVHGWAFSSDALVPQNYDPAQGGYGWEGTPTATSVGTPKEMETLRKYWSLIGVILGPPPFAVNEITDIGELRGMSNVTYGGESTSEISHKQSTENSVMISSDTEVKAGLKNKFGLNANLDLGFKWAWANEHKQSASTSVGFHFKCGTAGEAEGSWGKHGWVIFNGPNIVTQHYKLYAYDYDVESDKGSYLNQDIHTTQNLGMGIQTVGFDLADPGGRSDDIPGLLSGLKAFPHSTDLAAWRNMAWEKSNAPWSVIFGTGAHGGTLVSQLKQGAPGGIRYVQTQKNIDTSGSTTGADIKKGGGISIGSELNGFKENLTVGYDCQLSNQTEISTEVSKDIECDLEMPYTNCTDPDCVRTMTVQPYWLLASDSSAPWIPDGYSRELPWCMTWQVVSYETVGGYKTGLSPEPESSIAEISGVDPGLTEDEEAGLSKWSSYALEGGSMAWLEANGGITPIPMTADTFEPSSGAEVIIAGHSLKTDLTMGHWTRKGQVWSYRTREKAEPPAWNLRLDFGKQGWAVEARKVVLSDHILTADKHARIELVVSGKYSFFCDIEHAVQAQWQHAGDSAGSGLLDVTRYKGSYESKSGDGEVHLDGLLPAELECFGDLSFSVNGAPCHVPLISKESFEDAMARGGELLYQEGGLLVRVDFGKKRWRASIKRHNFSPLMAPQWGRSKIEVRVGGDIWYSSEHQVLSFKTKLKYKRQS